MPIQIPNLDDRNYNQLLKETNSVITRYFPEYTDIGISDPAIALNELFCYLFDIAVYQINRITPDTRRNFAKLLGIQTSSDQPPEESLRQALAKLSRIDRAVTVSDISTIVKKVSLDICSEPVRRVCVIQGNPVHVFLVQKGALNSVSSWHKDDAQLIYSHLRICSPLGTRYLIQHSTQLNINVSAEVVKNRDSTISDSKLATDVKNRIKAFFDPFDGGSSGNGWEFGRSASRGEIYSLIEEMADVDHVKSLLIKKHADTSYGATDRLTPTVGGLVKLISPQVTIV